jgi:radical SAM superfamily enzyme YgiQ (UPF0313 family)
MSGDHAHPLFRPPAEAHSLIIRAADGCPWNRCTFCGMYKAVKSRYLPLPEIEKSAAAAARASPLARRVFLADGDVMSMPCDRLKTVLGLLRARLPRLGRVNMYANGGSILRKSAAELRALRQLGLHTLYMGLESGYDPLLQKVQKRETAEDMVEAARRAQAAGLKMSIMILTGLGGYRHSGPHARATAAALNRMQPRLLSALRVIPVPGTGLHADVQSRRFVQLTEYQAVEELADILRRLELKGTLFRANHASNIIPLEGRFPRDRERLLDQLDQLLASGRLDTATPGIPPASL